MNRTLAILALAGLLAACSDDGAGPELVRQVEILNGASSLAEESIRVGDTLQLSASLRGRDGSLLTGRSIQWSSTNRAVATVDATGRVAGIAAGDARIVASADLASDTVRLTVVPRTPPGSALECAADDPGLSLQVGEVRVLASSQLGLVCLAGAASGAEFALVPFNAATSTSLLQVEVAANGAAVVTGPPSPYLRPSMGLRPAESAPGLLPNHRFHAALRERERRELTPRIGGARGLAASRSVAGRAAVPQEGDLLRLNVNSKSSCDAPDYHTGRVVAVTQHAVVVADTSNPAGGFTDAEYREFGLAFDTLVHPVVSGHFGEPTDIDANQRAVIFYTRAVNEMTEKGSTSYTGGFFYGRDLFPKTDADGFQGCTGSNFAEMFYMLVADPQGEINGNQRSKEFVAGQTVGVLAHEYQHLILGSRRLRVVNTTEWIEESWLSEGLSHVAEELVFYAASGLEPRQDLTVEALRERDAIEPFNRYQASNLARYIEYLQNPDSQSVMGLDQDQSDVATRGAAWAFLRYAADRAGADEGSIWKGMVDTERTGLANLGQALNADPMAWMQDWTVSVYTDNAVATGPVHQQSSWNFRNLVLALRNSAGMPAYPTYPLQTVALAGHGADDPVRLALPAGAAGYLRMGVLAGTRGAVRFTSGGVLPPGNLRLSVVRTR